MFFLSVYGLHLSMIYIASHLKIVPGCPVLGSFGASLLTRAPIHRFTPLGWHHDVHDFRGAPSVKQTNKAFSPSRVAQLGRPRNNDNRTPTHSGGNTRHGPTRGEALHALASSRGCARWSVATAPAQRPCTITKHNGKALAARCARGVEGKGEQLSPTYLEQCRLLGGQNNNIGLRCL